jgi:hypothetical protein
MSIKSSHLYSFSTAIMYRLDLIIPPLAFGTVVATGLRPGLKLESGSMKEGRKLDQINLEVVKV